MDELIALIKSDFWPEAVDQRMIVQTEHDKAKRAAAIMNNLVRTSLDGKRFCDFGCGEGHCVPLAYRRNAKFAIGYDCRQRWLEQPNLTTDFATVANEKYDVVLLYDVLDHAIDETPQAILAKVRQILAPTGMVFLRCHPFLASHGAHQYTTLNRAYVHLMLPESDWPAIGISMPEEERVRVWRPMATYRDWLATTGFNVMSEEIIWGRSMPLFTEGSVFDLVKQRWEQTTGLPITAPMLAKILTIAFVEFTLTPT